MRARDGLEKVRAASGDVGMLLNSNDAKEVICHCTSAFGCRTRRACGCGLCLPALVAFLRAQCTPCVGSQRAPAAVLQRDAEKLGRVAHVGFAAAARRPTAVAAAIRDDGRSALVALATAASKPRATCTCPRLQRTLLLSRAAQMLLGILPVEFESCGRSCCCRCSSQWLSQQPCCGIGAKHQQQIAA